MSDKILIDRAVVRQALDALIDIDCADDDRDFLHQSECEYLANAVRALREALAQQPAQEPMLDCFVAPRPLAYSLSDYHHAPTDGPLHATWQDKPHRIVYDLIGAVRYYAAPPAPRPLTADRINELWRMSKTNIGWNDFETVVKEVESAHGIGATK